MRLSLAGIVRVQGHRPGVEIENTHGNGLHHLVAAAVLPPHAVDSAGHVAQHVPDILFAHRRLVGPESLHPGDAGINHQLIGLVLADAIESAMRKQG